MPPQPLLRTIMGGAFLLGGYAAAACDSEATCDSGHEGCPCASGGVCLEGLSCLSNYCVDPAWTPEDNVGSSDDDNDDDGTSFDNVEACNALADKLMCGGVDLAMFLDCEAYAADPCDRTEYFDCINDVLVCDGDVLDSTRLPECATVGQCA